MSSLARETADAMPEVLGKFAASRFFCFPTKWYGSFQTNAFSSLLVFPGSFTLRFY